MSGYRWDGDDLLLHLHVVPRACRDQFAELLGDAIKLQTRAPPVDGKANKHMCKWLAKQFNVPASSVTLESGETSRQKRLRIKAPRSLLCLPQRRGAGTERASE